MEQSHLQLARIARPISPTRRCPRLVTRRAQKQTEKTEAGRDSSNDREVPGVSHEWRLVDRRILPGSASVSPALLHNHRRRFISIRNLHPKSAPKTAHQFNRRKQRERRWRCLDWFGAAVGAHLAGEQLINCCALHILLPSFSSLPSVENTGFFQGERLAPFSGQDSFDGFAMNVGQAEVAALKPVGELFMVDAEALENRRVQIMNV